MSKNNIKGKICLITGGSSGIGLEVAKRLFRLGAKVIICGRSKVQLNRAILEIGHSGKEVMVHSADISKSKDVELLFKQILNRFNRIDVLINAAGIFEPFGLFESVPVKRHIKTLCINLIGAMRVCHKIIPIMKKQKSGSIILFSGGGIGGDKPLTHASSYFMSKGAIAIMAEVLAEELKQYNITINSVLPGQILTKSTKNTFKLSDDQLGPVLSKATRDLENNGGHSVVPTLNLITFLLSKKASNITGCLLSARWDDITKLDNLSDYKYKLRRIEGSIYTRSIKRIRR